MTLLYIEEYEYAMQLIDAIRNKFLSGVESIALVKDKEIIGVVFSPAACEKFLKNE